MRTRSVRADVFVLMVHDKNMTTGEQGGLRFLVRVSDTVCMDRKLGLRLRKAWRIVDLCRSSVPASLLELQSRRGCVRHNVSSDRLLLVGHVRSTRCVGVRHDLV